MLYLLQLVQALKFRKTGVDIHLSPLCDFLISRSFRNHVLGNNFYWFIRVECEDKMHGSVYKEIMAHFMGSLKQVGVK